MIKNIQLILMLIFTISIVIGLALNGADDYKKLQKLKADLSVIKNRYTALSHENIKIKEEKKLLKNNLQYLEELARKRGFVKKGEIIYNLKKDKNKN